MLVLCKLYNYEDIGNAFTYDYCYIDDNQLLYKVKDKNMLEGCFCQKYTFMTQIFFLKD